ncbi:condensin subunit [Saccharomycopsis crataegensis]|uniref:Structural maintenance of chromosomes protein n=1 Tax=Saccharomycopsis crataegensis TaxID=43959 RepID=A0AAV5QWK0_9ASCO|nr:condensin subunit [Saccharomycopsis crataegensis]
MPLNVLRSPLKSINSNVEVVSPSKNRFIADEKPDLPPPSASASTRPMQLLALSPTKNTVLTQPDAVDEIGNSGSKSRLVIDKLVLTNFKSYVGVQEVGPFHSSFSAVVGPNGSGKSNVIDSMLFVFGFRANKMRQAKLSELIHNSDKHQNLSFCSVDVHFKQVIDKIDYGEDESPVDVVPGEDLVITRKAYRNNSSEYYINGNRSNYTEVTTLLKDQGIDLDHKRFLILQGEVESIAQMKPKAEKENDDGLLEYLEDIIGTAQYKSKIENSLDEVNNLNDVCVEKENRFEIVEKEKDNLEDDKDKALNFLKLDRQLTLKKSVAFQAQIHNRTEKSKENLEKFTKLKERLDEERKINADLHKEIKDLDTKYSECSMKIKDINEQINKLQKKQRQVDKENVRFDEQKKNLNNKIKKSEKMISATNTSLQNANTKLENHLMEQKEYEEELKELQSQLEIEVNELESVRKELSNKTKPFTDEISKIQKELQPWNEKLNAKESQVKVAESNVELIESEFSNFDKEIAAKQDQMEKIVDHGKKLQEQLISLKKEKSKIQKQIEHGTKETKNAEIRLQEMKENLTNTRHKVVDAKNSLSNSQNKSKVLSGLLRLQRSGRISGFYGRLGDLAVIDDQYDVAISTACSQLDDMVVETVEIGQQCIEYLRSQHLGYARFICLNKLRQFRMDPINTPMNCPRLFDLISPKDPKFLPAFYSVLRDTLVAENLNAANRAAYGSNKRYRVVTLDGKLIDTSGTLSGGGNYVHRGGMRTKSNSTYDDAELYTEEDVNHLESELVAKEKHFQVAQDTLREMETALKSLHDRDPEIDVSISKIELEMKSLTTDLASLTKIVEDLNSTKEATIAKLNSDLTDAKDIVTQRKQQLAELKDGASSLENQLEKLEQKIMDIGGVKLKMQKSEVDGINQKIEILNHKSSTTLHSIKKAQNEIKRSEKTLKNSEVELSTTSAELAKIEEEFAKKDTNTAELEKQINKLNDEKESIAEEVDQVKEELGTKKAKINELKSTEIELENSIEKYEAVVRHDKKAIASIKHELDSLEFRDVSHLIGWLDLGIPVKKAAVKEKFNKKKRKRKTRINDDGEEVEVEEEDDVEEESEEDNEHGQTEEIEVDENEEKEEDANKEGQEDNSEGENENDENGTQAESGEYDLSELKELKELFNTTGFPILNEEKISELDLDEVYNEIESIEGELENIRVDVNILEEYGRRASEYHNRKTDLNDAVAEREKLRDYVEELKKKRLNEFMKGFYTISSTLKEMYQMITMGGNAELELVDSLDPFAEGILFSVMPPKKSWKNISNLSGGEKTLSSLALVFALHKYKPTPLYVMDEIDAALDFRNVSIVANYIKERTQNAQFIVISLRNNMFELAQRLVGIYKVQNMTRSVTLKNRDILGNGNGGTDTRGRSSQMVPGSPIRNLSPLRMISQKRSRSPTRSPSQAP